MSHRHAVRTYCAGALLAGGIVSAHAAHYPLRPIRIAGGTEIQATAINDSGHIVGNYRNSAGGNGFLLRGDKVTVLPLFCSNSVGECIPLPTAITRNDQVGGYYSLGPYLNPGFVWDKGTYITSAQFELGEYSPGLEFVALNEHGNVAFNESPGDSFSTPYSGPASAPNEITGVSEAIVSSINEQGAVAGTYNDVFGGHAIQAIFVKQSGRVTTVVPPGAQGVSGGFINNHGQVAGAYVDAAGKTLGLIYHAGHYMHFGLPSGASEIAVQAINDQGYVVGVFTQGSAQRVFIYNGKRINVFGKFGASDIVGVALNNVGDIVVADRGASGVVSYLAKCEGPDC